MTTLLQDIRFGWRMLRRRPLVTGVAAGSLIVGLGALLVVFTLFNAIVLRPLAVADPDRVALVLEPRESGMNHNFSYQDFVDLRAARQEFSDLAASSTVEVTRRRTEGAEVLTGQLVSGSFFPVLGVRIVAGRGLAEIDDDRAGPPVVVVSETLWRRMDHAAAAPTGESVVLNGTTFTVVGVVAAPFRGLEIGRGAAFWAPLRFQPVLEPADGLDFLSRPGVSWLTIVGRLRPHATFDSASAELTRLESTLPPTPNRNRQRRFSVVAGRQGDSSLPSVVASPLSMLFGAGALLLMVACANVAGLFLARTSERQRELALRTALGASTGRVARLLTAEAILLGTGSTIVAGVVAWFVARAVAPMIAMYGNVAVLDLSPDWRLILFATVLGFVATALSSVLPLVHTLRRAPLTALAEGGRSSAGGAIQSLSRRALVVTQFALALALVSAAALLGRTLINLRSIATGFDLDRIAVVEVDPRVPRARPGGAPSPEVERASRYIASGLEQLAALPGVNAVGYAQVLPLDFGGSRTTIDIGGYSPAAGEDMEINFNRVSAGYFGAMGLAPRDGRLFDDRDVAGAPLAAVVNETMAQRYWRGRRAVGEVFRTGPASQYTVIGVVADVKYRMLREDAGPSFYLAAAQGRPFAGAFHVRTERSAALSLEPIRRVVAALDPSIPVKRLRTLRTQADTNVTSERMSLTIAVSLAGVAVVLAAAGLYAAMSFAVSLRTREIGVRMALGALPAEVRRLLVREGITLALLGSAFGLGLSIATGGLIRARLFGVAATDALSLAMASLLLTAVALIAVWAPARRAARVDPMTALRTE